MEFGRKTGKSEILTLLTQSLGLPTESPSSKFEIPTRPTEIQACPSAGPSCFFEFQACPFAGPSDFSDFKLELLRGRVVFSDSKLVPGLGPGRVGFGRIEEVPEYDETRAARERGIEVKVRI